MVWVFPVPGAPMRSESLPDSQRATRRFHRGVYVREGSLRNTRKLISRGGICCVEVLPGGGVQPGAGGGRRHRSRRRGGRRRLLEDGQGKRDARSLSLEAVEKQIASHQLDQRPVRIPSLEN